MAKPNEDDDGPGMDRGELKAILKFARHEPVRFAFALDTRGKIVIVMDKRKQPRVLDRELKEQMEDGRTHRFGTAEISEDQPKVVKFMLNKGSPGIARRLALALKGTGYREVEINSDDGGPPEKHEEPGDDELEGQENELDHLPVAKSEPAKPEPAQSEPAHTAASAPRPAPPAPAQPAPAAANGKSDTPDTGQLVARLVGLVRQINETAAANPDAKSSLQKLAAAAQKSLREAMLTLAKPDLERAVTDIDAVEKAVRQAATATKPTPAANAGPAAPSMQLVADRLTKVAKQAVPQMQADPARAPQLRDHLLKAQASLKSGDLAKATHHTDSLAELCAVSLKAASNRTGPVTLEPDSELARAAAALERALGLSAGDMDRVEHAFSKAFGTHAAGKEIIKRFSQGAKEARSGMEHGQDLAKKLHEAARAKQHDHRSQLMDEARTLLKQGLHHLTTNPLMEIIDANPVIKVKIKSTLQAGYLEIQRLLTDHASRPRPIAALGAVAGNAVAQGGGAGGRR